MEASCWSKPVGAVPGVDYPDPPAAWRPLISTMTEADREEAWKAFVEREVSPAEMTALREVTISRDRKVYEPGGKTATRTGVIDVHVADLRSAGSLFSADFNSLPIPDAECLESGPISFSMDESAHNYVVEDTTKPASERSLPSTDQRRPSGYKWKDTVDMTRSDSSVNIAHSAGEPTVVSDEEQDVSVGRAMDPTPSVGLGLGPSAFNLRGEADADAVLRAMLRRGGRPTTTAPHQAMTGAAIDGCGLKRRRRHSFATEVRDGGRKRREAAHSGQKLSALAKGRVQATGLSSGNTPAMRHHTKHRSEHPHNAGAGTVFDVNGQMIVSHKGVGSRLSRQRWRAGTGENDLVSASDGAAIGVPESAGRRRQRMFDGLDKARLSQSASVPVMFAGSPVGDRIHPSSFSDHVSSIGIARTSFTYSAVSTYSRPSSVTCIVSDPGSVSASNLLGETVKTDAKLASHRSKTTPCDPPRSSGVQSTRTLPRRADSSSGTAGSESRIVKTEEPKRTTTSKKLNINAVLVPHKYPKPTHASEDAGGEPQSTVIVNATVHSGKPVSKQPLDPLPSIEGLQPSQGSVAAVDGACHVDNDILQGTSSAAPSFPVSELAAIAIAGIYGVAGNKSTLACQFSLPAASQYPRNNETGEYGSTMVAQGLAKASDATKSNVESQPGVIFEDRSDEQEPKGYAINAPALGAVSAVNERSPLQHTLPNLTSADCETVQSPPEDVGDSNSRAIDGGRRKSLDRSTKSSSSGGSRRSNQGPIKGDSTGEARISLDATSNDVESHGGLTSPESVASTHRSSGTEGSKVGVSQVSAGSRDSSARGGVDVRNRHTARGGTSEPRVEKPDIRPAVVVEERNTAHEGALPRLPQGQRAKGSTAGPPRRAAEGKSARAPSTANGVEGVNAGRRVGGGGGGDPITRDIKVYSRPSKVESEDLLASVEALTTHHLTLQELLGVSACEQSVRRRTGSCGLVCGARARAAKSKGLP